jgi:hypothetical protein
MSFVLIPLGGLGNRLRVILSYLLEHQNLKVIWKKDSNVAFQHFLEVFMPIDNISFVESSNDSIISTCVPIGNWFATDWSKSDGQKLIHLIKPLPHILSRIEAQPEADIAIHARRTDHTQLAKSRGLFTSDETFMEFIDSSEGHTIYIATDNQATLSCFLKRYPDRILSSSNFIHRSLRHTNLEDSVVDWLMCCRAKTFLGSGYSSFSDLIELKRAS